MCWKVWRLGTFNCLEEDGVGVDQHQDSVRAVTGVVIWEGQIHGIAWEAILQSRSKGWCIAQFREKVVLMGRGL